MLGRRRPQRLDVELTARGVTVFWHCEPGVVVRRTFPSASLGCEAAEALRRESPRTLEASLLLLDRIARTSPTPHPTHAGPGASRHQSHLRHPG